MILSNIRFVSVLSVFLFPLFYIKGFAYAGLFPHAIFIIFIIELLLLSFLLYGIKKGKLSIRGSWIIVALVAYIIVLFLSAILGPEFKKSFWSGYTRMTGLLTYIHYLFLTIIMSSCFTDKEHWVKIFRAIATSTFILALVSFLGYDGLKLESLGFLKNGGSFLENTSYSGIYYLLACFISIIGYIYEKNKNWRIFYVIFWIIIFFSPEFFNFAILTGDISWGQLKEGPSLILGKARASAVTLWFGLISTLVLYLVHKIKSIKISTVGIVSFFAIVFVATVFGFVSILNQKGKLSDIYINEAGLARPVVWGMAMNGIKEKPIFGYGLENFEYVYQDNLDVRIMTLEGEDWFDKAHNFNLDNLVETGVAGSVLKFIIFALVLYISLKLYRRNREFYLLLIPLILLLNFIQLQVLFETDSGLLLTFIMFAFIVSHENIKSINLSFVKNKNIFKYVLFVCFILSSFYFVITPSRNNLAMAEVYVTPFPEKRIALYGELKHLRMAPFGTLHLLSSRYMDLIMRNLQDIQDNNYMETVGDEFSVYIDLYENYLPRYEERYRFLIDYAEVINTAFIFKVDKLQKGEDLLRKAINISEDYPHAFLLLSANLYYQNRDEEALVYAKKAYDLDPNLEQTKELMDLLDKYAFKKKKTFIYFTDI